MKVLRPYQQDLVRLSDRALATGHKRHIIQVPTGGGKTVVAAEIVRRQNVRVLYVVPSIEILRQTEKTLRKFGVHFQTLSAGTWPRLRSHRVVLAMAQTLARRIDWISDTTWRPGLIVFDEAHRLLDQHVETLLSFPVASIGLTATPVRLDGKPLGWVWPLTLQGPSVRDLQKAGTLCPVHTVLWPIAKLKGLRVKGGDFDQSALEQRLLESGAPEQVAASWAKYLKGRKCLAFCPGRHVSQAIVEALTLAGARAVHVDAQTPAADRDLALAMLARGQLDVVSNCGLFVEGLDVPTLDAVICCRPTMSLTLWLQMAGRGMRTSPGKKDCMLIDHGDCTNRLGNVESDRDWGSSGAPR